MKPAPWLVVAVVLIWTGELSCLVGVEHRLCHVVFYAGIACGLIGVALYLRRTVTSGKGEP